MSHQLLFAVDASYIYIYIYINILTDTHTYIYIYIYMAVWRFLFGRFRSSSRGLFYTHVYQSRSLAQSLLGAFDALAMMIWVDCGSPQSRAWLLGEPNAAINSFNRRKWGIQRDCVWNLKKCKIYTNRKTYIFCSFFSQHFHLNKKC